MPGVPVSTDQIVERLVHVQSKQRLMTVSETDTPTGVVSFELTDRRLPIIVIAAQSDLKEITGIL